MIFHTVMIIGSMMILISSQNLTQDDSCIRDDFLITLQILTHDDTHYITNLDALHQKSHHKSQSVMIVVSMILILSPNFTQAADLPNF